MLSVLIIESPPKPSIGRKASMAVATISGEDLSAVRSITEINKTMPITTKCHFFVKGAATNSLSLRA